MPKGRAPVCRHSDLHDARGSRRALRMAVENRADRAGGHPLRGSRHDHRAAYVAASRQDVDATTEVAALVVLAAGLLAGTGAFRLASGIIALEALLLVEKSRLHALVQRIDDVELRAGVRFAVMALVILPLLPEGPYGPLGGIRPRELWALVLFFSALSFLGHVARRLAGPGQGYLVTGLLGGLVSSTNVTFTFARLSRSDLALERALAFGAVGANAVLYPRVLVATAVLNPALVSPLIPYLAMPAVVAALTAARACASPRRRARRSLPQDNPLQLRAAIQMAVLFQGVLMVVSPRAGDVGTIRRVDVGGRLGPDRCGRAHGLDGQRSRDDRLAGDCRHGHRNWRVGEYRDEAGRWPLFFGSARFRTIVGGTLALMIAVASVALLSW